MGTVQNMENWKQNVCFGSNAQSSIEKVKYAQRASCICKKDPIAQQLNAIEAMQRALQDSNSFLSQSTHWPHFFSFVMKDPIAQQLNATEAIHWTLQDSNSFLIPEHTLTLPFLSFGEHDLLREQSVVVVVDVLVISLQQQLLLWQFLTTSGKTLATMIVDMSGISVLGLCKYRYGGRLPVLATGKTTGTYLSIPVLGSMSHAQIFRFTSGDVPKNSSLTRFARDSPRIFLNLGMNIKNIQLGR